MRCITVWQSHISCFLTDEHAEKHAEKLSLAGGAVSAAGHLRRIPIKDRIGDADGLKGDDIMRYNAVYASLPALIYFHDP